VAAVERARLEGHGHGERPITGVLLEPEGTDQERAAAVLVHLDAAQGGATQALAEHLVDAGLAVLVLDPPADGRVPSDRVAVLDLEAALGALADRDGVDGGRLAVVGLGAGGTLAFLAGCASRRVAAVVVAGGSLVRGALDAAHPTEPLELALNLGAPVLVLHGTDDPATPPEQSAQVEVALSRSFRAFELERVRGLGSRFLDPGAPGYHPDAARAVGVRIVRFLRESLTLD
jgi:dipeptidyl aminopeptidase/acylaminoacyl peptidase